jgi:DNA-binding response OmpR family regulator
MRIAVLEDDALLQDVLRATIQGAGHVCHAYMTSESLLKDLRHQTFDLLILDWHLPDMDGPEVAQAVRKVRPDAMPILFLTRRNGEQDVIDGLTSGGDDFMTKPVRTGELMARIQALLRRAHPTAMADTLDFGRYRFEANTRTVVLDGKSIELKNKEYELALCLFQNAGRLMSRDHLREKVWADARDLHTRTLDTHVSRIRTLLLLVPESGYALSAVYGIGYRLDKTPQSA